MLIREEGIRDEPGIRVLHREAFGREDEGRLVDLLRGDGLHVASLVATEPGPKQPLIVGHVLFSDLRIETQSGVLLAVSLAPVAVLPDWRRRGIAASLIREGLILSRERGRAAAIVLGEPAYYSRFGFSSQLAKNLKSAYSDFGAAWMALELTPGALHGVYGLVRYPEAFEALGL